MNRKWTEGTDRALDFIGALAWDGLPAAVRQQSKRCLLDLMGALVAGQPGGNGNGSSPHVRGEFPLRSAE